MGILYILFLVIREKCFDWQVFKHSRVTPRFWLCSKSRWPCSMKLVSGRVRKPSGEFLLHDNYSPPHSSAPRTRVSDARPQTIVRPHAGTLASEKKLHPETVDKRAKQWKRTTFRAINPTAKLLGRFVLLFLFCNYYHADSSPVFWLRANERVSVLEKQPVA